MKKFTITIVTQDGKYVKTAIFAESVAKAASLAETTWPGRVVGTPYQVE